MTLQGLSRLGLAAAITLAASSPLAAQGGYLFHRPDARFTVRGGYDHANANSDLFKQVTTDLSINKSDFSSFTTGAEVTMPVTSRFEVGVDVGYSGMRKGSDFRHFEDNNNRPIEQTTIFQRVPVMANVRFYLTPPGRSIGTLAWIPTKVTPWVSGGVGTMWYRFRQEGDFVDFNTLDVFSSYYESTAWTEAAQASAGVDFSLSPLMALRTAVQGVWAKGPLTHDFVGFDKIDLSSVNATIGLSFRL